MRRWVLVVLALPASAVPLEVVEVSAPAINCVFDGDCRITVNDSTAAITLPAATGQGFLQTRTAPPGPALPAGGRAVLGHGQADKTFEASVEQRPAGEHGSNEYVFYDGPPFANGLPHYGHLLTGYVKDLVPRYQTMRGRHVERRFGWDCHGLPAEVHAERQLGITTRLQQGLVVLDLLDDRLVGLELADGPLQDPDLPLQFGKGLPLLDLGRIGGTLEQLVQVSRHALQLLHDAGT